MYKVSGYTVDKSNRTLWRSWVLLNVFGGLVGALIASLVVEPLTAAMGETLQRYFVVGSVFLFLGLHQIHLTRYLRLDHGAWTWNTGWGSCAGLLLVYPLASAVKGIIGGVSVGGTSGALIIGLTCIGLGVGAAQWFLLRGRLSGAGLWVPVSAIGAGAGSAAGFLAGALLPPVADIIVGSALGMTVYAIITGAFLLMRLPAYPVAAVDVEEENEDLHEDDEQYQPDTAEDLGEPGPGRNHEV
jgi:hypothetical protein